jgi:hypothetical protein
VRTVIPLILAAVVAAVSASCSLDKSDDSVSCQEARDFARLIAKDEGVEAAAQEYRQVGDRKPVCEPDARDSTALVELKVPRGVRVSTAEDRVAGVLATHGWDARSTDCLEKAIDGHLVSTVLYVQPSGAVRGPASVNLSMYGYLQGDSRCEDMER